VDWTVIADDWGAHPSTTQHLVLNLPPEDAVVWVDSIGMRPPALSWRDLRRLGSKLAGFARAGGEPAPLYPPSLRGFAHVSPKVLPWHLSPLARRVNAASLRRSVARGMRQLGIGEPVLLTADPVVVVYADALPHSKLAYLRLDDYSLYPGVDRKLVEQTEARMFERADAIIATATALLPGGAAARKAHYVPQGVRTEAFADVPLEPARARVLGFFGTLSNWLDYALIEALAERVPDWRLDFVGNVEVLPARTRSLPNARFLPAVPFRQLPELMRDWAAAWIPFQLNELTQAVNPLKVREYLAAGLPTHCTPLPEVMALREHVFISDDPDAIARWLREVLTADSRDERARRRKSVEGESWRHRAAELRRILAA
jgi:hypothetical protein